MEKDFDKNINKKLFSIDYLSDFSEDETDKLSSIAQELIDKYGDKQVFAEWYEYLKECVTDKKTARNFAYWFFQYGGHELKIKNPYPFLALLFVKTEVPLDKEPSLKEEKEFDDLIDSIYVSLLSNAGIIGNDNYFYINFRSDEKLINLVNKIKFSK